MKKVAVAVCFFLIFTISAHMSAYAEDITIKGIAQFKCSLIAKYMEKHGFSYINEVLYNKKYKTNLFGAKHADIIIKDSDDMVVAHGKADDKGEFAFQVPSGDKFKIAVSFRGRKIQGITRDFKENKYIADLGHFSSDEVGSWISLMPISYCYDCDIRYLEARGASL